MILVAGALVALAVCAPGSAAEDELLRELTGSAAPRGSAPRSPLVDRMDAVFLRFLQKYPGRAPGAFADLFRSVAPEPLARFLMERAEARDYLRVIAAMPKLPFLSAALSGGAPR